MSDLDYLFAPRSVALVGASGDTAKPAGIALANLARFRGRVYPVNPRCEELGGLACYRSVREIPETVDLSVVMRPAAEVPDLVREHRGKARCVLVVSAGFAETGAAGLQEELRQASRQAGVRIMGPNCLGVYNPFRRLDTFFLPPAGMRRPRRGNVAVASQSGAVLVSLLDALGRTGIGVSRAANYGNAVDIDAPEIYDWLAGDSGTEVVIVYLESVGDGRRFVDAARHLAAAKPFLLLKGGKAGSGQAAAFSHTGRLAGSYEVFHSILGQFGIREAADFDGLLDAAHALACRRAAPGNRVCIITNAGGHGVLAADACQRQGLVTPPLPEAVAVGLRATLPSFYTIANPIDLTGQVRVADYRLALDAVRDHFDGFLVIALTGVAGVTLDIAPVLREFAATAAKPLAVHIAQGGVARSLVPLLEKARIPVYPSPERAVRGLRALLAEERP